MLIKEENYTNYTLDSLLENTLIISDCINSTINQIPVVYNEEGNYCLVKYRDIEELQEQYNFSVNNAVSYLSDFNNINPNSVVLAVNESDIIEYPEIASILESENTSYVIDPIPMDNPTVQLCDYLVEEALETGDESCLDVLEEDYTVVNEFLDELTPEEKKEFRKKLRKAKRSDEIKSKKAFKRYASLNNFSNASNYRKEKNEFYRRGYRTGKTLGVVQNVLKLNSSRKPNINTNNNDQSETKPNYPLAIIGGNGKSNNTKKSEDRSNYPLSIHRTGSNSNTNSSNFDNKTIEGVGRTIRTDKNGNSAINSGNKMKLGLAGLGLGAAAFAIKNRKSIINRIKGLRAKSDQLEQKMQAAPVEKKGLFRRIIDKIKSIIQKLIAKLKSLRK